MRREITTPRELPRLIRLFVAIWAPVLATACGDGRRDGGSTNRDVPVTELDSVAAIETPRPAGAGPPSSEPGGDEDLLDARRMLESYYAAIREGAFSEAYYHWADSGRASGQTIYAFEEGFAGTATVALEAGKGNIEGAAGSRYAEFPVRITATTREGTTQRFEGTYVLRRSVVDGATQEQRAWRIYSADIRQLP